MPRLGARLLVVLLALFALALSAWAAPAEASHYRYGHITFRPQAGGGPTAVEFTYNFAVRRNAYGGAPVVGSVVQTDITMCFGDSSPCTGFLYLTVTAIDPVNNWMSGVLGVSAGQTTIPHTYASAGSYLAFSTQCCRIGVSFPNAHINNPDETFRVEALVPVGGADSSPVSALPPIILCQYGTVCTFQIPGADPDGNVMNFRLATAAEGGGTFNQPPGAAVSSTGLYTWNTAGVTLGPAGYNTLYSTQVIIEERNLAGAVIGKVALDFLIQLTLAPPGNPPEFDHPPTPPCGTTFQVNAGTTLSFTVQASDQDAGDVVTLNVAGLPPGATMNPPLPASGNPVSSTFSWTPTAAQQGTYVVTFSATDQTGQQALCSFTIVVSGVGPPASLVLDPPTDTNPAGEQHCVTATVRDAAGNPTPGITVRFSVSGANSAGGSAVTNASGQAQFCYTGTNAGTDTITAYADTDNDNTQDAGEPSGMATKIYVAAAPATLTLDPATATNPVDTEHCVTATVKDAFGNPTPGITVRFSVTGSVNTSGSATTDANGQAKFCYDGPALPGMDAITAYADTDDDNTQDAGEPSGAASKTWVLPVTTPGCEIKITNGGWIIATNGDRASFGGNAKADADGNVSGNEEYQDHGPATPFNLHGNVLVIVCNDDDSATIFGEATIDGSGSHTYRIDVQDNGESGKNDRYRMRVNAYDSGDQQLQGGNVQIHRG
jgi:hypothetical protein